MDRGAAGEWTRQNGCNNSSEVMNLLQNRSKESWSCRFNCASELVSYSFDLPPSYSFFLELV